MNESIIRRFIRAFVPIVSLIALMVTVLNAIAASDSDPDPSGLFTEAGGANSLDFSTDATIVGTRFVKVKFALLDEAEVGDSLVLNLFDDVSFTAILDSKVAAYGGGYAWSGHLEGVPLGGVVLIVRGGQLAGVSGVVGPGDLGAQRVAFEQAGQVLDHGSARTRPGRRIGDDPHVISLCSHGSRPVRDASTRLHRPRRALYHKPERPVNGKAPPGVPDWSSGHPDASDRF